MMDIGLSVFSKYRSIIGLDIEMKGAIEEIDKQLYSRRICTVTIGLLFCYLDFTFKIGKGDKLNMDFEKLKQKLNEIKEKEKEFDNML